MPTTQAPEPTGVAYAVPAFLCDQYMLGDCVHLAHALADRNPGWGVLVAGDADYDEDIDLWDTGTIWHAWAVRPDGALVDIEGVHPRSVADDLAATRAVALHQHTTADAADQVWAPTAMDLSGPTEPEDAALWVMENWGNAPAGTRCTITESDTDDYPDDEDLDY